MISIQGLTVRQKSIMDMLWSMDSMDKVNAFIKALPTRQDQMDAATMIQIAVEETVEQEQGLEGYEAAALAAIRCAMLR